MARSVRASTGRRPVRAVKVAEQRLVPVVGRPALVEGRDHGRPADVPRAGGERQLAEQEREQRRLAAAVPSGDRDALTRCEVEVDRAEPEGAALSDRTLERRDAITLALRRGEREVQLPRLVRLLDSLDPLQRALGLTHLPDIDSSAPVRPARRLARNAPPARA